MVVAPRIERPPTQGEMSLLARGLRTDTQVQDEIIGVVERWLGTALASLQKEVVGRIMEDILAGRLEPPPLASELKRFGYKADPARGVWDNKRFWEAVSGDWATAFEEAVGEGVGITAGYQAARFYFYVDMELVNGAVRAFTAETYIPDLIKLDGPKSIIAATRNGVRDVLVRWMDGDLGDQGLADLTRALERWFSPERARRIGVTEATRVYALGNREAWRNSFRDPEFQQATGIRAMGWQTARNGLVCATCRPLNGKQVLLDRGFPVDGGMPPAHPFCRCWLTPIKNYNPKQAPRRQ